MQLHDRLYFDAQVLRFDHYTPRCCFTNDNTALTHIGSLLQLEDFSPTRFVAYCNRYVTRLYAEVTCLIHAVLCRVF